MAIQRLTLDVLMEDGTEHLGIKTTLRDQQTYSDMRARFGWAPVDDDEPLAARVMAYAALRRLGLFTGTYDQFLDSAAAIQAAPQETVDPTQPEASHAP